MFKSGKLILMACLVIFIAGCNSTTNTTASNQSTFTPERVSIPDYLEFLDNLEMSIAEGEPRELDESEQRQFASIKSSLVSLIGTRSDLEEFDQYDKERLFNLHQRLQTVVIGDPSTQVICRQERTTGSNMRQTRCMTRQQADDERKRASQFFGDLVDSGRSIMPVGN
ncbi:hypothetical protein FM042_06025 [Aliidiomarina halalkaliphila]|uniref:Uncharacterized protein n=1 Tax=Aliidiomarina halalkaliphila TaxID=2593535 RepID=A0A552X5W7_9GAMM|nr:hypothetical protein [Aliidiomarina halalkaliphila]TRW50386.1 hypothetical protein FM042_06025 [Aliidiomarina halalkaliphila]